MKNGWNGGKSYTYEIVDKKCRYRSHYFDTILSATYTHIMMRIPKTFESYLNSKLGQFSSFFFLLRLYDRQRHSAIRPLKKNNITPPAALYKRKYQSLPVKKRYLYIQSLTKAIPRSAKKGYKKSWDCAPRAQPSERLSISAYLYIYICTHIDTALTAPPKSGDLSRLSRRRRTRRVYVIRRKRGTIHSRETARQTDTVTERARDEIYMYIQASYARTMV